MRPETIMASNEPNRRARIAWRRTSVTAAEVTAECGQTSEKYQNGPRLPSAIWPD